MTENLDYPVTNITNNFAVRFEGHKNLEQNITELTIPGLNIGQQETYNMHQRVKLPSRSVEPDYDELIANFNVLENYSNYFEVWRWIKDYKKSIGNEDYRNLMKDITVFTYDLNKILIRKIYYKLCFPSMLSDITINNTQSEPEPAIFTVNFVVNDIVVEDV